MNSTEKAEAIGRILLEKKGDGRRPHRREGKDDFGGLLRHCDGRSLTHVRSLAENLEEEMDKIGVFPLRREGVREGRWAVLDYGDVFVHIFNDESRLFYHLERLWDEGNNLVRIEDGEPAAER